MCIRDRAYTPQSNGCVERVNGTLKNMIFRYITESGSSRWIDVIEQLVENYNSNKHSTTGVKPIDAIDSARGRTQAMEAVEEVNRATNARNGRMFEPLRVGDHVRTLLKRPERESVNVSRGYLKNWSDQVYEIMKIFAQGRPNQRYILRDEEFWYPKHYKRDQLLKIVKND